MGRAMVVTWLVALAASLALVGGQGEDLPEDGQGDDLPEELEPFVPEGHQALDFAIGDLDGDARDDAILILQTPEEVQKKDDMEARRPLILLIRQPDGRLDQARRTDRLVHCRTCGGMMGDPYVQTLIGKGRFTVSHYGGSASRWGIDYTFAYDPAAKEWFLDREESTTFHAHDPDQTRDSSTLTREQIGDLSIETFDATGEHDTKWRVAAARSYFYDRPDPGSRPRKAYLVRGDIVEGWRVLRHFIQGRYTSGKGDTTLGFLLKTDLEALPEGSAR